MTSITLTTGATILDGHALARIGAVILDTNRITVPSASLTASDSVNAPDRGPLL